MRSLLVVVFSLFTTEVHAFNSPFITPIHSPAASTPRTTGAFAFTGGARAPAPARRGGSKRNAVKRQPPVGQVSGKIDGLTKLAPFKIYGVGAALLWAIVGSVGN